MVVTIFKMEVEFSCVRPFGSLLSQNIIFFARELLFPLLFGFVYTVFFVHEGLSFLVVVWNKIKSGSVDAVPFSCGIAGPVVKNMSQVAATNCAMLFGTGHTYFIVCVKSYVALDLSVETWPPSSGFKLVLTFEQGGAATGTNVGALFFIVQQLAGKSIFRGGFSQDVIFHIRKLSTPFCIGFVHFKCSFLCAFLFLFL